MEIIDWNNPPNQLRFVVNLNTGEVDYISDDLNHKGYNTKPEIERVFASGSRLVNIVINTKEPFHKYKLILETDHVDCIIKEKISIRHLTYEKI